MRTVIGLIRWEEAKRPALVYFVAMIKTVTKSNLGEKGFISSFSLKSTIRKELKSGTWRQELK